MNKMADSAGGMEQEPLLKYVLGILRSGGELQSKDCISPVFKWLKAGGKHFDPEKAFRYAEWVIQLRSGEIPDFPLQPQVRPEYVFNTIITMSQRNNSVELARRAHRRMLACGLQPDIFALTALLDVTGRNGDLEGALQVYQDMIESVDTLPNVVTFVTLIRLVAKHLEAAAAVEKISMLLSDARGLSQRPRGSQVGDGTGVVDDAIYNAAMAASVKFFDLPLLTKVLRFIKFPPSGERAVLPPLTYEILSKFSLKFDAREEKRLECGAVGSFCRWLLLEGILTTSDVEEIAAHRLERERASSQKSSQDSSSMRNAYVESLSCLGPLSPPSLRETVLHHDLMRLAQRLLTMPLATGGSYAGANALSESDFVTLIHQCRKRKWTDQIKMIVIFMKKLCLHGVESICLPPYPNLKITMLTIEAAMEGFLEGGYTNEAWGLFEELIRYLDQQEKDECILVTRKEEAVCFHHRFTRLVISGFIGCLNYTLATKAYFIFRNWGAFPTDSASHGGRWNTPSKEIVMCIMRASGAFRASIQTAVVILADLAASSFVVEGSFLSHGRPDHCVDYTAVDMLSQKESQKIKQRWIARDEALFSFEDFTDFLNELFRSCALIGSLQNLTDLIEALLASRSLLSPCPADGLVEPPSMVSREHCTLCLECLSDCVKAILSSWNPYYLASMVMANCASYDNTSAVLNSLYKMQRCHLLPSLKLLHVIALEALAGVWSSREKAKEEKQTLPFRSFVLSGIPKYVDGRASYLESIINLIFKVEAIEGADQSLLRDLLLLDVQPADEGYFDKLFSIFYPLSQGPCIQKIEVDSGLLRPALSAMELYQHGGVFFTELPDRCADNNCYNKLYLIGLVSLQHTYCRFISIKTKADKQLLLEDIIYTFTNILCSVKNLWTFVSFLLVGLCTVVTEEKSAGRFLLFLSPCIAKSLTRIVSAAGEFALNDTEQSCIQSSIDGGFTSLLGDSFTFLAAEADRIGWCGLDLIKILNKSLSILGNACVAQKILQFATIELLYPPTKLAKTISFLRLHAEDLAPHLDFIAFEQRLAEIFIKDITIYLHVADYISFIAPYSSSNASDAAHRRWKACIRIVSILLTAVPSVLVVKTSPRELQDLAVRLMFKFYPSPESHVMSEAQSRLRRKVIEDVVDGLGLCDGSRANISAVLFENDAAESITGAALGNKLIRKEVDVGDNIPVYSLPIPRHNIILIDSDEKVPIAARILYSCCCVSIDVEWKPTRAFKDTKKNKCALLQIACLTHVFLFDLIKLEPTFSIAIEESRTERASSQNQFFDLISMLFASTEIVKLGFGILRDIERLRESFPLSIHYGVVNYVVDLREQKCISSLLQSSGVAMQDQELDDVLNGNISLSNLLTMLLGRRLDKTMQTSDWEARPLSEQQILYAANDAYCVLEFQQYWDYYN